MGGSEVELQRPKYHPPSNDGLIARMRSQPVHLLKRQATRGRANQLVA